MSVSQHSVRLGCFQSNFAAPTKMTTGALCYRRHYPSGRPRCCAKGPGRLWICKIYDKQWLRGEYHINVAGRLLTGNTQGHSIISCHPGLLRARHGLAFTCLV